MRNNKPTVIDLFCGAGGLSEGFRMAGYDICAAIDNNVPAMETHKLNHPLCEHITGDIKDISAKDILKIIQLKAEDVEGVIGGPPCFEKGTLVKTKDGYKKIEDINIGDYVLTHLNRYKKVLETMTKYTPDLYELKVYGTENFKVTGNHPFYTLKKTIHRGKTYSEPQWITTEDLDKNCYIGIPINNRSELPKWQGIECAIDLSGGKIVKKHLDLSNPKLWWLIGRYVGDGYLRIRKRRGTNTLQYTVVICSPKQESDYVESRIRELFSYSKTEGKATNRFHIVNKELGVFIEQFGQKAHNKHLTADVLNLPTELLRNFIEGYVSVGGGYLKKENTHSITTISPQLAYGIQTCIHKVYKLPCRVMKENRSETRTIEGKVVKQYNTYQIKYKTVKAQREHFFYKDGYMWFPVKLKKKIKFNDYVYNLEVEKDHSYTVFNLACHNCQGFSSAGKRGREHDKETGQWKFIDDPRNKLYKYFVGIVKDIQPKFFVLENVVGMATLKKSHLNKSLLNEIKAGNITNEILQKLYEDELSIKLINRIKNGEKSDTLIEELQRGRIVQAVIEDFEEVGYEVKWQILNAANYGVPQERNRLIYIGTRRDLKVTPTFPKETHCNPELGNKNIEGLCKWETVGNAILDLPLLKDTVGAEEMPYDKPAQSLYQKFMRGEMSYKEYLDNKLKE